MLAAAIIVFREMLELGLILGIISAALHDVSNKLKLILLGSSIGIVLCSILAITFHYITNMFDGNGQEILNIIILAISIICITLTLIWINDNIKNLHLKLANNYSNSISIILIIALATAREGAEAILFLYGILASGAKVVDLVIGLVIGLFLSSLSGIFIYTGLLKLPTKYFFKIINILLILLAAGMSSQLANYLSAIGIIEALSSSMWNSQWLIADDTIIGRILYSLIGYSSHPTELQVLFYATTILSMMLIMKVKKITSNSKNV